MEEFDVVVIGGGPGGYVCAIRAAQLGKKTACIESRGALGGTCLNVGCIPSKSLLHASEMYSKAQNEFKHIGINTGALSLDLAKMMDHKAKSVEGLTKGIEFLFKKNKVSYLKGHGSFKDNNTITVKESNGSTKEIKAKNIVIATGSSVLSLPNIKVDEEIIVSSTGALSLKQVPKKMIIIGGGVIGLEMGSVWLRLGAAVEVIEYMDHITPGMDREICDNFLKILKKQGMKFHLSSKVLDVKKHSNGAIVTVETVGKKTDPKGRISVDKKLKTSVGNIYAIGDVIEGPMLAHKAEDEGMAVAEFISGKFGHINYDTIPGVVYTAPEVAAVGKTEEELKKAGIEYNVGKFPFMANSRAKINNDADGFIKILADKVTDKVLGVHMIGPDVGTMIAEVVLAMEFGASAEDIARTCHAHPTLTEAVREAALAVDKRAIHF